MEEGRLTDSFGRTIDFKNTILIMTTNIGAETIINREEFGLGRNRTKTEDTSYRAMQERLKEEMNKNFKPEFINRVDDIIVFRSLNKDDLKKIVDIELSKVIKRLKEKKLEMVITEEAKELLIEKGTSLEFGARPLRRAIENLLEDPLAEDLLKGVFLGKDKITVKVHEVDGEKKVFFESTVEKEKEPESALVGAAS
jgi:ATP-dependent Clp protease ATP-binding subunit ClpC